MKRERPARSVWIRIKDVATLPTFIFAVYSLVMVGEFGMRVGWMDAWPKTVEKDENVCFQFYAASSKGVEGIVVLRGGGYGRLGSDAGNGDDKDM